MDIDDTWIQVMAGVLRESGYSAREADRIVERELAPFLGVNHWSVAGEWSGFDPDWVCEQAEKRFRNPGLIRAPVARLIAKLGITTFAMRGEWDRIKNAVYGETA